MRSFRFIHTADLHLDSPFQGLSEIAPALQGIMKEATLRAFHGIVDLCLKRQVDFLLIAGDVHDAADRNLRSLSRLRQAFERLAEHHISVFLCHGNHDPLSGWGAKFSWPENVHVFGSQGVEGMPVFRKGVELARVYGRSYDTDHVTENLAKTFQREEGAPWAIGLLHTNVGNDPHHLNYAPCEIKDLVGTRMDYWALGHIHAHRVLHSADPLIVYPGNPQGRHLRERGPRGCYVVEVNEKGHVRYEFVPVDVVRWHEETVSIEGLSDFDDLLNRFEGRVRHIRRTSEGRGVILRWRLEGRGMIHRELAKPGRVEDVLATIRDKWGTGPAFVWSESMIDSTARELDWEALRQEENLLGDFLRLADEAPDSCMEELRQVVSSLFDDPRTHRYLDPPTDDHVRQWVQSAQQLGIDRLVTGED